LLPLILNSHGALNVIGELIFQLFQLSQVKDGLGWEPIHEAVRSGHLKAVELFIEHNIDINKITYTGVSPLNIAREFLGKDHAVTKKLVENGAIDINVEGEL
jgi:ankyrin repeat protein